MEYFKIKMKSLLNHYLLLHIFTKKKNPTRLFSPSPNCTLYTNTHTKKIHQFWINRRDLFEIVCFQADLFEFFFLKTIWSKKRRWIYSDWQGIWHIWLVFLCCCSKFIPSNHALVVFCSIYCYCYWYCCYCCLAGEIRVSVI